MITQVLQVNASSFPYSPAICQHHSNCNKEHDQEHDQGYDQDQGARRGLIDPSWLGGEESCGCHISPLTLHANPPTSTYIQDLAALKTCADCLRETTHPVAFPSETVYGLGAHALSAEKVKAIYRVKGRPSDNPLIVHVSSLEMARSLLPNSLVTGERQMIPDKYIPLLLACWPGPLTILLPKGELVPDEVTAGHASVAVRMPSHPVARALIDMCGFPIAAPSANTSGRPSPTRAAHVLNDLGGRIPFILDGGECSGGVESTVLDGLSDPPVVLRPGGITVERIRSFPGFENVKVFKRDFVDESMEQAPVTPGMKYKHYSPRMAVILFEVTPAPAVATTPAPAINCDTPTLLDRITSHVVVALRNGARQEPSNQVVGILRTSRTRLPLASHGVAPEQIIEHFVGDATAPASVAQGLFHGLRSLEAHNVSCILVEGVSEQEEGLAVMNRLRKAATHIL